MTDSNTLKQKLANELAHRLEHGELNEKTGQLGPAKPATLTVALNFLKEYPPSDDNFVTGASSEKIKGLAGGMKFARSTGSH